MKLDPPDVSAELVSMLDHLDDAAILLSRDYRVLAANRAYRARYGVDFTLGEARCHWISHRYDTPCDLNGESCPLRACLERDGPARVTHVHQTPRGPEHCDILLRPLRDATGRIVRFVEIIRPLDIAGVHFGQARLLGRSRAFSRLIELVERVAPSEAPALLLGESGTGKELLAQAIHARSPRAAGPFVPLACSGLSPTLFESELFGHEQGAFTGATRRREGLVDAARGGTLFLDEIGDVPLGLQVKLLRLLESGTFRRVGGTEPQQADFRLVCATHRDLEAMVAEETFRQDLYFRVHVFPIHVPALRQRPGDIPLLARELLARRAPDKQLSPAALEALQGYEYPGNVRELRNVIERAVLMADGDTIEPAHLPGVVVDAASGAGPWPWGEAVLPLEEVERRYLRWAAGRGLTREALADRLGVSLRTLYRKLADE
ncbi:MAG: sigma 54-interacting transcriptional regulator [Alphaproteobacteria bacterium]|nr:sigma 54-interacting transcriptional regulator [Alphaproteobacteria bacterium]